MSRAKQQAINEIAVGLKEAMQEVLSTRSVEGRLRRALELIAHGYPVPKSLARATLRDINKPFTRLSGNDN